MTKVELISLAAQDKEESDALANRYAKLYGLMFVNIFLVHSGSSLDSLSHIRPISLIIVLEVLLSSLCHFF